MQESAGKRLKALIEASEILVLPGVFDGFSTRLVSHAGYTAAFITGSGVSESRLGQSDVGIMGMVETLPRRAPSPRAPICCCWPTPIPATVMVNVSTCNRAGQSACW